MPIKNLFIAMCAAQGFATGSIKSIYLMLERGDDREKVISFAKKCHAEAEAEANKITGD